MSGDVKKMLLCLLPLSNTFLIFPSNDEIYIHDRGFDPETMRFIYGNQRDIPYQLERVTTMATDRTRKVVNNDLKWTLGPTFRTPKEYEAKLANVGGPSRPRK